MTLHPDQLPSEDVARFERIGIPIPSMMYVYACLTYPTVLPQSDATASIFASQECCDNTVFKGGVYKHHDR